MKQEFTSEELNKFLGKAALAGYAGGGEGFTAKQDGFFEYEYREGDFSYKDRFTGFFTSAGMEVVWYKGKPVWIQGYGGGMTEEYRENEDFANETFTFLQKTLSRGEKLESFQPRGPKSFTEGDWKYQCEWKGDIAEFKGEERIFYKGKHVFTHYFFGGFLAHKE